LTQDIKGKQLTLRKENWER